MKPWGTGQSRHRTGQAGQALVETALVVGFLVILTLGAVEFGRAWMILNSVTHVARDGARAAAIAPLSDRNTAKIITNLATYQTLVTTELQNTIGTSTLIAELNPNLTLSGVPMVQMTVTGTVPYIFNIPFVGTSFSVNRSVTFRDEGR